MMILAINGNKQTLFYGKVLDRGVSCRFLSIL